MICLFATLMLLLAAAVPAAASRLLVVSKGDRALQSFDGTTYAKQFTVKVKGEPHEVVVSPDGRFAYLADFEGLTNTITEVDLSAGTVARTIDLKPHYKPHGMTTTRDGTRLFITCEANRVVAEVDLAAGKVFRTFALNELQSHLLALSPDQQTLYVTSLDAGNVTLIDIPKGELSRSILSGKGCEGLDVTPDGSELWVVNRVAQTLGVIDLKTHKRVTTLPCVGNPLRIRFTGDGKTAMVTCAVSSELAFFDRVKRSEVARTNLGGFPTAIALDNAGGRCFVTNAQAATVSIVNIATRKLVKTFRTGPDPEGIVYHE